MTLEANLRNALLVFLFFFVACESEKKELIKIKGHTMGTYYQVRLYDAQKQKDYIKHEIEKFLASFNQEFSTYVDDSLISKVNSGAVINLAGHDRFKELLLESLDLSKKTKGYFDITVGGLVELWGFNRSHNLKSKPSVQDISEVLKSAGFEKIKLKDNVILKPKKMKLDMSANAKGLAVDELSHLLTSLGYKNHFVEIGGETKAMGQKGLTEEKKDFWRVGVEGPSSELGGKIVQVVSLKNMAIATSGNYRNYLKMGDEVFGHTLNPKTGKPIQNKQVSVTVLDTKCSQADAYATALMAMPYKEAIELAEDNALKVFIIYREGEKLKKYYSLALKKYQGKE